MQMPKSPPELIAYFAEVLPNAPDVVPKKMFGYPSGFVNDNLFMGLHGDCFILRLGAADREELLQHEGAQPFEPMEGRPMKEYVVVPEAVRVSEAELKSWIDKALQFGRSLPPKVKKVKSTQSGKTR
jgi:TfoX/Sxy family transcriptional regulator of competence genes